MISDVGKNWKIVPGKIWTPDQCQVMDSLSWMQVNPSECREECAKRNGCNAFNYRLQEEMTVCQFMECPEPIPEPISNPVHEDLTVAFSMEI